MKKILAILITATAAFAQQPDEEAYTNAVPVIQPNAIRATGRVIIDLDNNIVRGEVQRYSTATGAVVPWPASENSGGDSKRVTITLNQFLNATDNTNTVNGFSRKLKKRLAKEGQ